MSLISKLRELGLKQFLKTWKKGIDNITAYQQVRGQLIGMIPIIIGIIIGIVITIISKTWWLVLILSGSLIVTFFQLIGTLQRFIRLRVQELIMKNAIGGDNETEIN